jgi:phage-related minor tail protein
VGLATKEDLDGPKAEVRALKATAEDFAQTVDRINKRDVEDTAAHAENFVNHERRITRIEKQLELKPPA